MVLSKGHQGRPWEILNRVRQRWNGRPSRRRRRRRRPWAAATGCGGWLRRRGRRKLQRPLLSEAGWGCRLEAATAAAGSLPFLLEDVERSLNSARPFLSSLPSTEHTHIHILLRWPKVTACFLILVCATRLFQISLKNDKLFHYFTNI